MPRRRGCPTTSRAGRSSSCSSGPAQRGSTAVIRRAMWRAVPDGRSALPRRCHSTIDGSKPARAYMAAACSARRRNSAAPSARLGATTAAAPCSSSMERMGAASASQALAAMMNRRLPASSACARLAATAMPAEASTTTSARGAPARRSARIGAADQRRGPALVGCGVRDRASEATGSVDEEMHGSDVLSADGSAVPEVRRITKAASPFLVIAAPSAPPVPEAPWFVARASSEPLGPSLPAGPPRLLPGVEGDERLVRHGPRSMPICHGLCNYCSVNRFYAFACVRETSSPWGPAWIAATSRGVTAVELLSSAEGFRAGLERRGVVVDAGRAGEGASRLADRATRAVAEAARRAGRAARRPPR